MKEIIKKFKDFSYLREDVSNEDYPKDLKDSQKGEIEESPLSEFSERTGLSIDKDDRGDFIRTEEGDIIRYFSETGYYNETTKKKYGESIQDVLDSIQPDKVSESRSHQHKSCRNGCRCGKK